MTKKNKERMTILTKQSITELTEVVGYISGHYQSEQWGHTQRLIWKKKNNSNKMNDPRGDQ